MLCSCQFQIALKRIICVEPGFVTIDYFKIPSQTKQFPEKNLGKNKEKDKK